MARNYASCHPERIIHGNGLCGSCYITKWNNSSEKNIRNRHKRYLSHLKSGGANQANWRYKLKKNHNMTVKDFNQLMLKQKGKCAICRSGPEASRLKRRLCIDHCHKTGVVRGLLCDKCNRGIGLLQDSAKLLKIAVLYLEKK